MTMEKLNQLSLGEKLIAGGGALMLIASFLRWFSFSVAGFASGGYSGWGDPGSLWSVLAVLVSITLAGLVLAIRLGNMQLPALPEGVTLGRIFAGGAAVVVILMVLKAWRIQAVDCGGGILGDAVCDAGFGIGFFLGALATIAIAAGGYLLFSEERAAAGR